VSCPLQRGLSAGRTRGRARVRGLYGLAERVKAWFEQNSHYDPLIVPGSPTLDGCYEIAVHGVPEPFASWVEELG
jgi:hypothetical protein